LLEERIRRKLNIVRGAIGTRLEDEERMCLVDSTGRYVMEKSAGKVSRRWLGSTTSEEVVVANLISKLVYSLKDCRTCGYRARGILATRHKEFS
jgi:hypothetical protein